MTTPTENKKLNNFVNFDFFTKISGIDPCEKRINVQKLPKECSKCFREFCKG